MNGLNPPCKNCKDRYVGCHSKCLRYIDYQQLSLAKRKEEYEQKGINATVHSLKKEQNERT